MPDPDLGQPFVALFHGRAHAFGTFAAAEAYAHEAARKHYPSGPDSVRILRHGDVVARVHRDALDRVWTAVSVMPGHTDAQVARQQDLFGG